MARQISPKVKFGLARSVLGQEGKVTDLFHSKTIDMSLSPAAAFGYPTDQISKVVPALSPILSIPLSLYTRVLYPMQALMDSCRDPGRRGR